MNFSELVKGQELNIECPKCNKNIVFDASLAFEKNSSITCPDCSSKIELENSEARKEAEKIVKQIENLFK